MSHYRSAKSVTVTVTRHATFVHNMISAISADTVHHLTSGQVVTDLSSAVKELLDNSLDAGASQIEVRFRNYGLDSVELVDNGTGISSDDFENLARKYHTSKLASFDDLDTVSTLGFRGEAMSSLCALADVVVTTATAACEPVGTKLVLGRSGDIVSRSTVSANKGTTVAVNNLFTSLPVRRKNFERHVKREYSKALTMVQAYAIIASAKISVVALNGARRSVVFSTTGNSVRDNLVSVYGAATVNTISSVDLDVSWTARWRLDKGATKVEPSQVSSSESQSAESAEPESQEAPEPETQDFVLDRSENSVHVTGFVSKPIFGMGRNSADRQLLYINRRPCVLPAVAKVFTEVYRQFNTVQAPLIVIDLQMDPSCYDVNVSPDKRTIMIHQEARLVEALRPRISSFFEAVGHSVPLNVQPKKLARMANRPERSERSEGFLDRFRSREGETAREEIKRVSEEEEERVSQEETQESEESEVREEVREKEREESGESEEEQDDKDPYEAAEVESLDLDQEMREEDQGEQVEQELSEPVKNQETEEQVEQESEGPVEDQGTEEPVQELRDQVQTKKPRKRPRLDRHRTTNYKQKVSVQMSSILKTTKWSRPGSSISRSDIADEAVLNLLIHKADFNAMRVIGQFNLGFILVSKPRAGTHTTDLFIIDQHASDEKFNFERLQAATDLLIQSQPLVIPQTLQLSAVDEITVEANQQVFRANGFKVAYDESATPGSKIRLLTMPVSKGSVFDQSDFNELVHLIHTHPGAMVRCSKVRAMLAMRACRSSIMIGQPLRPRDMVRVVRNLAGLDKPWNCPHGRPTLRHLTSVGE